MATAFVASTPTPGSPTIINTPPTPRLGGFADNWEPYTPVRKSARLSSRSAANRTPSPHQSGRTSQPSQPRASPRSTSKKHQPTSTSPKMASSSAATASPQKKRLAPTDTRRVSAPLTAESIRNAATALGQPPKMDSLVASSSQAALALPTPAKTPAQKHSDPSEKNVNAIARNLFSKQQSSPRKSRAKQYKLDSFEAETETETFQIYTDSQDRVPEPDAAGDNPFYGEAGIAASARPVRRSSRHKKNVAGDSVSESLDEVVRRDDGLLYVL